VKPGQAAELLEVLKSADRFAREIASDEHRYQDWADVRMLGTLVVNLVYVLEQMLEK
jgi:hypothetical protein